MSLTKRRNLVRRVKSITRESGMAGLIAGTGYASGSKNAGKNSRTFFRKGLPGSKQRRKQLADHVKRFRVHPSMGGAMADRAYARKKKYYASLRGE